MTKKFTMKFTIDFNSFDESKNKEAALDINTAKYLFKLGDGWVWSKIYYSYENKFFIEERYHEEYLDVGTICDGEYLIEDDDLWERLIKEKNKEGIFEFLKIRGTVEKIDER